jgi:hypothetical protein
MSELKTLAEIENAHIALVLRHTHNNKTRSAEILGVDRRTLYRKVKSDESLRSEFLEAQMPVTREQLERRIAQLQEQLTASSSR